MVAKALKRADPLLLDFEPVTYRLEEIICPGSDEEDEEDEESSSDQHRRKRQRRRRRRRIESAARQYLRGQPLLIQTASLRGPLHNNKNWKNPWARKSSFALDDLRRFPEASRFVNATEQKGLQGYETVAVGAKKRALVDRGHVYADGGYDRNGFGARDGLESVSKRRRCEIDRRNGEAMSKSKSSGYTLESENRDRWLKTPHGRPTSKSRSPGYTLEHENHDHWLKTPHAPQQSYPNGLKLETPTPVSKILPRSSTTPHENIEVLRSPSGVGPNHLLIHEQQRGPTPIHRASTARTPDLRTDQQETPRKNYAARVRERNQAKASDLIQSGDHEAKPMIQGPVMSPVKQDGHLQARKLSQPAAQTRFDTRPNPSRLAPYVSEFASERGVPDHEISRETTETSKQPGRSMHAVPPSTYQRGFQYRYARKPSSSSSHQSDEVKEAPEQIPPIASVSRSASSSAGERAAEGKSESEEVRRLTFTASGGARIAGPRTKSGSSSGVSEATTSAMHPNLDGAKSDGHPVKERASLSKVSTRSSDLQLNKVALSRSSEAHQEAQIIPEAQQLFGQPPSGPSSRLLDTGMQLPDPANWDEGDSYINLSTQAAITKAHRSFQNDILQPFNRSPPTVMKEPKTTSVRYNNHEKAKTPTAPNNPTLHSSPLSTQAMLDTLSPFAISTIKKRPSAPPLNNFHPLPLHPPTTSLPPPKFSATSPTMSTSPSAPASPPSPSPSPNNPDQPPSPPQQNPPFSSPEQKSHSHPSPPPPPPPTSSKPPSSSTLTSFSILPNGTLTETSLVQQDGQQVPAPEGGEGVFGAGVPDAFDLSSGFGTGTAGVSGGVGGGDGIGGGEGDGGSGGGGGDSGEVRGESQVDLDKVIEDAQSFLGEWDVRAEVRRVGGGRGV